jgi:hypothetical protein
VLTLKDGDNQIGETMEVAFPILRWNLGYHSLVIGYNNNNLGIENN